MGWFEQATAAERESLYDAQEFLEVDLDALEGELMRIATTSEDFLLHLLDELDLCRQLWEERDSLPREHAGVYVDEVQDLCEVEWMLLAQMVRHSGGLFFTGDPYQALRPSGFYWKRLQLRLGRNLQVQEGSLSLNLRNTRQIAEFVQGELERIRAKYHMGQQPDYRVTARKVSFGGDGLVEGCRPCG